MKSPHDLHTIIKSLTKSEKRLFKLQVSGSQKSENNYTILFDAIDAQTVYNEQKLLQKLSKHNFSKQISRTKFLLYEQILKVLRQFYSSRSEQAKLDALLYSVDVLIHKTLYTQAYKVLNRGKKMAIANHLFSWQQKFLEKEKELLPLLENHKTIQPAIQKLLESYEQVYQKLHTENLYRALHTKVRMHFDTFYYFYEVTQINALFNETMNNSLMKEESKASSFFSKVLFMEISFLNAQVRSNLGEASYWGERIFQFWQDNPLMKSIFKIDFIRQLRDFTFFQIVHNNNVSEVLQDWNYLKINASSKEEEQKYQFKIDTIEFIFHLTKSNSHKCNELYGKLNANSFLINSFPLHQRIIVFFYFSVYHLLKKEYALTKSLIKKIEENVNNRSHLQFMKFIHLMKLIVENEIEDQKIEYHDILNIQLQVNSLKTNSGIKKILLEAIEELIGIPKFNEKSKRFRRIIKTIENNQFNLKQHPDFISHQVSKLG